MLVRFAEELPLFNQFVMRLPIGKPVQAVVLRDGSEKAPHRDVAVERESVEARVRELPLARHHGVEPDRWSAKELKRARSRRGPRRGVRPGGPADEAKPSADRLDDVIVAIDGIRRRRRSTRWTSAVESLTRETGGTPSPRW